MDREVEALFARVQLESGRLDLLVNNVWGGYERYELGRFDLPFWEQPLRHWEGMFTAGVRAHLTASRLAARMMIAQRSGLIINTTAWDRDKYLGNLFYDVAKAAVNRMAWGMARELRAQNIAAVALAPGFMRTERVMAVLSATPGPDLGPTESPEYVGPGGSRAGRGPQRHAVHRARFSRWAIWHRSTDSRTSTAGRSRRSVSRTNAGQRSITQEAIRNMVDFFCPSKIITGDGCASAVGAEAAALGAHRVWLVTDKILREKTECVSQTVASLRDAGLQVEIFDDVEPDPLVATAVRSADLARVFGPDVIVGIGGGSPLDIAKATATFLGNDVPLEKMWGRGNVPRRGRPLVLLPTTGGTGSEASTSCVLTDTQPDGSHMKRSIVSQHVVPNTSIVDPLLTLTVPPSVTAATGMDALTTRSRPTFPRRPSP